MAQPVMMWRKFLPHTLYRGRKGGKKFTQQPRWVGLGRVVLHELIPGQDESDRCQVVWVVLGNVLYRASVHSIRPLSEREDQLFEAQGDDSHKWKELTDMIPSRNYVDVTDEEPTDEPHLPDTPNYQTKVRFWGKHGADTEGLPILHHRRKRTMNLRLGLRLFKKIPEESTSTRTTRLSMCP